jgi:hypothetical protein
MSGSLLFFFDAVVRTVDLVIHFEALHGSAGVQAFGRLQ